MGTGQHPPMRECRRVGRREWKTSHLAGGLGPDRQGSGCQSREDGHYSVSNREPLKDCEQRYDMLEMNLASHAQYEQ